jgi:hypothetical protein
MPTVRVPIKSLNGGVSTRASSKRLPKEVEGADNVLLTVSRSAEKRPPITHIDTETEGNYLNIPYVTGATLVGGADAQYNSDNLYFHFIDVDGANRYCIILNRAVSDTEDMIRIYRIEPTEWIREEFDRFSFDRGMKEYLLYDNLVGDTSDPVQETIGSITHGAGAILFNKRVALDFLPDNSGKLTIIGDPADPNYCSNFYEPDPGYIHAGDKITYKTADMFFVNEAGEPWNGGGCSESPQNRLPNAHEEDLTLKPYTPSKDTDGLYSKWLSYVASPANGGGYKNVVDDIESRVNSATLEAYEVGHSLPNFGEFPLPPAADDTGSHNGWKARAMLKHLYHRNEGGIKNTEFLQRGATGYVQFLDVPDNGVVIVLTNTESRAAKAPNAETGDELFKFKFDNTTTSVSGSKDAEGRYIVGINGLTDEDDVAINFQAVAARADTDTRITAAVDGTDARKVNLTHKVLGIHGNVDIYSEDSAGVLITSPTKYVLSGFSDGTDSADFGYLTSPFSDVAYDGSIAEYPSSNTSGFGEIFYARDPYFSFQSGFYRVVSNVIYGQPYFQQVRAEDKNSVIDHRTMPVRIRRDSDGVWRISYVPALPKSSGSAINNPGPTAIKNKETIKAIEFWKGRLWFATDTTIFSSRINDFFNFFIDDITNMTDADPIDISVNTGQFNLIQSLTSFQNFLFITTKSGTQFEIRGSAVQAGQISPTNIELRSTSFYSTASTARPLKMGNNIFFFDTKKLFLYSGSDAFGNEYSTAYELSEHCRGYLPTNFQQVTAIPSMDTLAMVDRDNKNHIYFYTTKSNGQQIIQNAFYRWVLDSNDQILHIHGFEENFYIVVKRSNGPQSAIYAYYATLDQVTTATPMLDRLVLVDTDDITYDSATNYTYVTLPYFDGAATEAVLGSDWGNQAYSRHQATAVGSVQYDSHYKTKLTFNGNLATQRNEAGNFVDRQLWVGRPYLMDIELSTLHYRDGENNSIGGVLNLKRLTTKHKNTGQYTVEIQRYARTVSDVRSEAFTFNDTTDLLGSSLRIDVEGELLTKVLGKADSTSIHIKSDFPTPCNILGLDVIGNFRVGDTSVQK